MFEAIKQLSAGQKLIALSCTLLFTLTVCITAIFVAPTWGDVFKTAGRHSVLDVGFTLTLITTLVAYIEAYKRIDGEIEFSMGAHYVGPMAFGFFLLLAWDHSGLKFHGSMAGYVMAVIVVHWFGFYVIADTKRGVIIADRQRMGGGHTDGS